MVRGGERPAGFHRLRSERAASPLLKCVHLQRACWAQACHSAFVTRPSCVRGRRPEVGLYSREQPVRPPCLRVTCFSVDGTFWTAPPPSTSAMLSPLWHIPVSGWLGPRSQGAAVVTATCTHSVVTQGHLSLLPRCHAHLGWGLQS